MSIKKVLAVINDEITAIQVDNLLNQPDLWELEFIRLRPEIVEEILAWQPDVVIFDISLLSSLDETDYPKIFSNNDIPFLYLTPSNVDPTLFESIPSPKTYNLAELNNAVRETFNAYRSNSA